MYKITTYYQLDDNKVQAYQTLSSRYWYDHVIYTRNTIVSLMSNGADVNASVARLIKNQDDIGNLFRPYYPADQVDQVVVLLKEHITQAGAIVSAVMAGTDTTALIEQWRANCDAIVAQLTQMNSDLAQSNLSSLWNEHLTLTINEIGYRQDKNWTSDIMNFDNILTNIQEISTIICSGVVNQFPLKFCTAVAQGECNEQSRS